MKRIFALATMLLTALFTSSCNSDTGGRHVELALALEAVPVAGMPVGTFTTDTGWTVTLTQAHLALGPLYLYADDGSSMMAALSDLLVPVAYAHGGVDSYAGRPVRAEYLDQNVFDALSREELSLGLVDGTAGRVLAVSLYLDPPGGSIVGDATPLQSHNAYVVGIATKDGVTVEFEGGLAIAADGITPLVEGVALDGGIDDGGEAVLGVHVDRWFRAAHFDRLTDHAPSGRLLIDRRSQVYTAWYLGIRATDAYSARWIPAAASGATR